MFTHQGPVSKQVANSRQLSQRGAGAIDRNDWSAAEGLYADAVKACPVDIDARRQYAETLWHRGDTLNAIAQLDEVNRISPDDANLCTRVGEMHLAAGHLEEARHRADQALDLSPQSAAAWTLRARVNFAAGLNEASLADAQRALSYQKADAKLLLLTAEIYRRLDRPQRALSTLESLVDTYPPGEEPKQVLFLQGLALVALGRNLDAVESYQAAAQKGDPDPDLLYRLAEAQSLAGLKDDATQSVRQALARDPSHAGSLALLQELGRPALAQSTLPALR